MLGCVFSFERNQYDTAEPIIFVLKRNDQPVDLTNPAVTSVHLIMLRCDCKAPTKIDAVMTILDQTKFRGQVSYDWQPADVDTAGVYQLLFRVYYVSGKIETFPSCGIVSLRIRPAPTVS